MSEVAAPLRIDVISVLPDMFEPVTGASMLGIARRKGVFDLHVHDLRRWALPGVHRQVDDAPYGGGAGMVLRPEPVFDAVEAVTRLDDRPPYVVLLTPQGSMFSQRRAQEIAGLPRLLLICGRYEGFDERIRSLADTELSVGDYVLTGGELPAMVVIDSVVRLLPGALGGDTSADQDSFSDGLLEYPQYTRPSSFRGMAVPDVLLSGDHPKVDAWRREQSVLRTAARRPELLEAAWDGLTRTERELAGGARDRKPEGS
jgi:tRNA (guanine37-N1)-methyltransferase